MIAARLNRSDPVLAFLRQILALRFVRYFVASLGALAVDMGSFLLLLETALFAGLSAAIAFVLGTIVQWVLVSRTAFADRTAASGRQRARQRAFFFATTFAGLTLTTGMVSAATIMGMNVLAAKILAVGITFITIYFVRKHFVFRLDEPALSRSS